MITVPASAELLTSLIAIPAQKCAHFSTSAAASILLAPSLTILSSVSPTTFASSSLWYTSFTACPSSYSSNRRIGRLEGYAPSITHVTHAFSVSTTSNISSRSSQIKTPPSEDQAHSGVTLTLALNQLSSTATLQAKVASAYRTGTKKGLARHPAIAQALLHGVATLTVTYLAALDRERAVLASAAPAQADLGSGSPP